MARLVDEMKRIVADEKEAGYRCSECGAVQGENHQWDCLNLRRAEITHRAQHGDPVNSPPHYRQGDIECIDAIQAALTPDEFRGYCKGNALKYIWRERHKGQDESLRKAVWYLNRALGQ